MFRGSSSIMGSLSARERTDPHVSHPGPEGGEEMRHMRGGGGVAHGEQVMVKCFSRSEDLAKLESQEGTHSHLAATSYIISSDSVIGAQNQSA